MTEYSKQISFWSLLKTTKVVVPIIQRDYAQGRKGKEFLRERFLSQLFDALLQNNDAHPLVLDFVYGSIEENTLYPLDGQQRLTTLWLLHWYLALCAGTLSAETEDKEILKRFTYETRVSSRTFCQKLCEMDCDNYQRQNQSIASFIRDQRWYYTTYDQDPTIQSMLRMLKGTDLIDSKDVDITDGIEEYFNQRKLTKENAQELLIRLKDEEKAPIKFYLLNMEDKNLPLTDDLYIKMNARGKILTDFENFKADLLQYKLDDQSYLIPENRIEKDSFSVLMDTHWTDIFWPFHSNEYHMDEIYMSFLNRFFLNAYIAQDTSKPEELIKKDLYKMLSTADDREVKTDYHYQSISIYKPVLESDYIHSLTCCLNNLYMLYKERDRQYIDELFRPFWSVKKKSDGTNNGKEPFYFVPRYKTNNIPTTLTFQQQIVFHAICSYLISCQEVNISKLQDWMHFIWNLVENSYIDKYQCISAIRFISRGINNLPKLEDQMPMNSASDDIITYLAQIDTKQIKEVFGKRQLLEEIAKAKKIKEDSSWKEKIHAAENFAFFKGAIAFLFLDEEEKVNWEQFDQKMQTVELLFDKKGVQHDKRVNALHTLYSYCDNWRTQFWWDAKIFDCSAKTWKENILTKVDSNNRYVYAKPVHHLLMGEAPCKESKSDRRMQLLANELLVSFLVAENKHDLNLYIRNPHDTLYYCGDKYGVMLNNEIRDTYLKHLLDAKIIELTDDHKMINLNDNTLFWGRFDINFVYHTDKQDLYLQWYQDDHIYLMLEDGNYRVNVEGNQTIYYHFRIDEPANGNYIESFQEQVNSTFINLFSNGTLDSNQ